jgi:hypothetical protein
MNKVRYIATALLYLSRVLAIPYLATSAYCLISFIFKDSMVHIIDGGKRFAIYYPFTQNRFIIGDALTFSYIFEMIAFIGLYGLFFWLLGNIFQTFREQKLFTNKGVKRLRIFYTLNFLVPIPFLLLHIIYGYEVQIVIMLALLHFVLGIFAYFMAVIFSRGLHLQNEQDLIF